MEGRAAGESLQAILTVDLDAAGPGHNLHALCLLGPKMELPGVDKSQSFLFTGCGEHGVAHDLAVEINIGLGVDRDVGELGGNGHG